MSFRLSIRSIIALSVLAVALGAMLNPRPALAAPSQPAWSLRISPQPTTFAESDCGGRAPVSGQVVEGFDCDRFSVLATNLGSATSSGPVMIKDIVPSGLVIAAQRPGQETLLVGGNLAAGHPEIELGREGCATAGQEVECSFDAPVLPGQTLDVAFVVEVESGTPPGPLAPDTASVEGGSAAAVHVSAPVSVQAPNPFSVTAFPFIPSNGSGGIETQAGAHPYSLSSGFELSTIHHPETYESVKNGLSTSPVEDPKNALVLLPPGLVGDPDATPRCPLSTVERAPASCPEATRVGTALLNLEYGGFQTSHVGGEEGGSVSYLYNVPPERGFPAEFALRYEGKILPLYASVVRGPRSSGGYRLRVGSAGIPSLENFGVMSAILNFYGTPAEHDGGQTGPLAFLRNPTACTSAPLNARIEVDSWQNPDHWVTSEQPAYPKITGCDRLQFHPSIAVTPETTTADTPSGYEVTLTVPQSPNVAPSLATPDLKDARVLLPQGVAISPSAANGLSACAAEGPHGINIGSEQIGPAGEDLADPEATELGAGHPGGNSSPYDDELYHLAPGHCPASSQIGDLEVKTPLLEEPLTGHVYVAEPGCGGSKSPCTEVDATDGDLYGIYLEASGSGVIVKLHGTVAANPQTGQLTATFTENPQLPFESFRLKFYGGSSAVLANPKTCGSFQTTSDLTPWSTPQTPDATPSSAFAISAGASGSGCASSESQMPNKPDFEAGTTNPLAGQYSPFVLKLSREDGSQRLRSLDVNLPEGLLARIAGTPYCPDSAIAAASARSGTAEKARPSCPAASEVGTVTVGAGPGSTPYYVQGHAYLAGPYKGAPLSLAIITPAVAGPFDLGTVVVRTALQVNESTAQVRAVSDQFPTILDGTPLDIRSIALNLGRSQFTLNPTSCEEKSVTGEAISDTGNVAPLTNRFAVGGCKGLQFKPELKLAFTGQTRRTGFPAVKAVLTQPKGENANLAGASVILPKGMLIANAHINNPCTRVQFNSGSLPGAGCPAKSILGTAKVWTPLLEGPEEGNVYFRSNGGERKLPDLVVALRGQIPLQLVGFIDSVGKKGSEVRRVRTRFQGLPDAPVSRFELKLSGGRKGLLQNSKNLCKVDDQAKFHLTGQNGATHDTEPTVQVSCPKKKTNTKRHR
jgi:hypothetical protein